MGSGPRGAGLGEGGESHPAQLHVAAPHVFRLIAARGGLVRDVPLSDCRQAFAQAHDLIVQHPVVHAGS